MVRTIRIGNAGGYWGDDPGALKRQLELGPLDYVTQDFLAEITMSILQKQRARKPELGYAYDFVEQIRDCAAALERTGTRLISNAGGINPLGCAQEVARVCAQSNHSLKLAVVEGDDLMERLDTLIQEGHPLAHMETGTPLSSIRDRVVAANVYLGAAPVVSALESGAQIIITGRVTDTGMTVAPPVFEFGWSMQDWDRLACAVVAGHILECGAQASGGNLTDWREVPTFQNMAYPVVEFDRDGGFVATKHPGTGGLVSDKTIAAQLVYEMGDPENYITPDVVADFSTLRLTPEGDNRVRVEGAGGRPRPDQLKVSVAYHGGYKAHGTLIVTRPDAVAKCRSISQTLWKRLDIDFQDTSTELVGFNACHSHLSPAARPAEILLRLGVRDDDKEKVAAFSKLFPSLILSSVSGVAIVGARPRIQTIVAYWPCLIPASQVTPTVQVLGNRRTIAIRPQAVTETARVGPTPSPPGPMPRSPAAGPQPGRRVPLIEVCWARSGDKGDTANIGVVARSREAYGWLEKTLTAERVRAYFGDLCRGDVERFQIPNLLALNFLLHEALGGGGTVSLRIDPQGKTLAEALLMMEAEIPESVLASIPAGSSDSHQAVPPPE